MIAVTVTTTGAQESRDFLVKVEVAIRRPKVLNDRLARALARTLQAHFKSREGEPNRMAAPSTGFWAGVRAGTIVGEVTDSGATVRVGVDTFFRIHFLGGTIKPTRRKFLTIPLIPAARGMTAASYERESGRKLFRPAGRRVLMERLKDGTGDDQSAGQASMRTKGGYKVFNLGAAKVRAVFALATEATVKKDPRALPPGKDLAEALQAAANSWAEREMKKGAAAK